MGERSGAPSGFSPASIVISKPPVALQLPQPDVSANRDAPQTIVQAERLCEDLTRILATAPHSRVKAGAKEAALDGNDDWRVHITRRVSRRPAVSERSHRNTGVK